MTGAITSKTLRARAETWWQREPELLERERAAMSVLAPELTWHAEGAGSWQGRAPLWPFERPTPQGLGLVLGGRRLHLHLAYGHAFPVAPPALWPLDPQPEPAQRLDHSWHVNGDGSLCLLQSAAAWSGREPAAELVAKASGWFIEYVLLSRGQIEAMTSTGISTDDSLDALISRAAAERGVDDRHREAP